MVISKSIGHSPKNSRKPDACNYAENYFFDVHLPQATAALESVDKEEDTHVQNFDNLWLVISY